MSEEKSCLLIGNSRWHWAKQKNNRWIFSHKNPNQKELKILQSRLWRWAAVGPIPKDPPLDPTNCIQTKNIPLIKAPEWIGVDRALASWAAFQKAKSKNIHNKGILIADAGTILSINKITSDGQFIGGKLLAGLQLQASSMSSRAENLAYVKNKGLPLNEFPIYTEEAILRGSFEALFFTLLETQKKENIPLWLCGGDSEILFNQLKKYKCDIYHDPNLAIEALTQINA